MKCGSTFVLLTRHHGIHHGSRAEFGSCASVSGVSKAKKQAEKNMGYLRRVMAEGQEREAKCGRLATDPSQQPDPVQQVEPPPSDEGDPAGTAGPRMH